MKLLFSGILIMLSLQFANGQETQSISKKSNGFREEYTSLASDKKIKHGQYKKYKGKDELIAEGMFDNDLRSGEWKFYVNGTLEQSYDYSSQRLVYTKKPEQPSNAIINGTVVKIVLDTSPQYLGSKPALNAELNKVTTYPMQALRMGIEGKVLISAWVTETNELADIKVIQGVMSEINEEVVKGLMKVDNNWIAGTKDGNKIKAELFFVIEFKLHDSGSKTITLL